MRKAPWLVAALLATVLAYPPASRAQHETGADLFSGEQVFQSLCANCHGLDGALVPNVDLGHGVFRQPYSDAQLAGIIRNGIPNTPMPANPTMSAEQAQLVVDYLRSRAIDSSRTLAGDAAAGRALFAGRGNCLVCHLVAGQGSPLGGELTRVGDSRTAVELTQSLRAPNAVVQPNQRSYALTTKAGVSVNGRLLNRDAYSVQLLDSEGRLRSFALEELATYGFAASPMPALGSDWSDREVADLVAYLASLRAPTQTGAAR